MIHPSRWSFRHAFLWIILIAIPLFPGCAGLESLFLPAEPRIERALEAGEYRRALELIDQHSPEPAEQWAQRRAEIEEQAQEAADTALSHARSASAEGAIVEALETLRTAEEKLPEHAERTQFMEQLERQREVGLKTLQQRHDILEAHYRVQQLRLIEIMRPLIHDRESLPDDPDILDTRREALATVLEQYAADTDGVERLDLLRLIHDLNPTQTRAHNLQRLEEQIRSEQVDRSQAEETQRLSSINAQLRQAVEAGELQQAARWCLGNLETDRDASGPDQAAQRARQVLCEEWRKQRDLRADNLLDKGRRQYTAGDIHEAVETWNIGLELAPDHSELATARERALRVIERLETLRLPEPEFSDTDDTAPQPIPLDEDAPAP